MSCVRCALRSVPLLDRSEEGPRALAQTGLQVTDMQEEQAADIAVDNDKLCPSCVAMFVMWFSYPEADGAVQGSVLMRRGFDLVAKQGPPQLIVDGVEDPDPEGPDPVEDYMRDLVGGARKEPSPLTRGRRRRPR